MSLIPEERLKPRLNLNLAPMIDFLFLLLAFFATLAVTRTSIFDRSLNLVELQKTKEDEQSSWQDHPEQIHISITKDGNYKWITDVHDYPMPTKRHIQRELTHQYNHGLIPKDKSKTQVLLHIDQMTPWETVADLIYSIREIGFQSNPVYQSVEKVIADNDVELLDEDLVQEIE